MTLGKGDRIQVALMRLSALGLAGFWVGFFASEKVRASTGPATADMQRLFLLSDAFTVSALLLAARGLSRGQVGAVPVGITASGAMTYLSGLNLMYALREMKEKEQGSAGGVALRLAPYAASVIAGPVSAARLWRARRRLEA